MQCRILARIPGISSGRSKSTSAIYFPLNIRANSIQLNTISDFVWFGVHISEQFDLCVSVCVRARMALAVPQQASSQGVSREGLAGARHTHHAMNNWPFQIYCHEIIVFNPFTPKSDQFQISPAASPVILHHILWRIQLFIALLRCKIIILSILTTSLMYCSLKGCENVLFELGSERVKKAQRNGELESFELGRLSR